MCIRDRVKFTEFVDSIYFFWLSKNLKICTRHRPNHVRACGMPAGATISQSPRAAVSEMSARSQPRLKLDGYRHHDGNWWSSYQVNWRSKPTKATNGAPGEVFLADDGTGGHILRTLSDLNTTLVIPVASIPA